MLRIMSDNDVQGHVSRVIDICQASPWDEVWRDLECVLCTFADLDLAENATDAAVWQACQENGVLLITGNRGATDPDSLEVTIRERNRRDNLPVLTLANPRRIMRDRTYAEAVVERLFEILVDIEMYRGAGRLYLP
jgi:Tfp pilus assembly ATPase PilU